MNPAQKAATGRMLRRRISMLIRDSNHTMLGVKKRRDGTIMLFRYIWYFDAKESKYKFQHWTMTYPPPTVIETETYQTLTELIYGVKAFLGLQTFHPGIERRGRVVKWN